MTTNGRHCDLEPDELETTQSTESSEQPSGVFRTARQTSRKESGWTIAETFEHEGFCYRVMRRPLELEDVPPRLTKREEDAVVLACAGNSNKRISQVMDCSPSTVGVLLWRAASKLKAKSRSELLSNYEQFKATAKLSTRRQ